MTPPDPPPPQAAPPNTVPVTLGDHSYDIRIGAALLAEAGTHIAPLLRRPRVTVVSDGNVAPLHGPLLERALADAGIQSRFVVLPPGEQTKSFEALGGLLDDILGAGLERTDHLVALGGGVIGDLTGFAAAIALRGVPFIQIPTTLLAQVDSSVGGKTAIDTAFGKNTVGAFHQPRLVLCDTHLLTTLPARQMRAGYAEVLKYGLLGDAAFLAWLETHGRAVIEAEPKAIAHAVFRSCEMKAEIVIEDEKEQGRRALLNLGHTFGHAIEAETGYSDSVLHGEAISIGMVMAAELSARLGQIAEGDVARLRRHLVETGLPASPGDLGLNSLSPEGLIAHMARDKKVSGGRLTFILLKALGEAEIRHDITRDILLPFLEEQLS